MKKFVLLLIVPLALFLGAQMATAQSQQKTTTSAQSNWNNFRPETLSGTISMVEPGNKAVFVTGSDNVSYKFLVTNKTKIEVSGTASSIGALSGQTGEQVTVTFVARPKGNVAHTITVSG